MNRIERIQERRRCTATVHLSATYTITRRRRDRKAQERGHPPDECGEECSHLVDGEPRCRAHAATQALAIVMGEA